MSAHAWAWLAGSQLATLAVGLWIYSQFDQFISMATPAAAPRVAAPSSAPLPSAALLERYGPAVLSFGWIAALQGFALWMYESHCRQQRAAADARLEQRQRKLHADVLRLRDALVFGLAKLAESRDSDTGHHLDRIAAYSTRLAETLRRHPRFLSEVTGPFVQDIGVSSALHDIGKVAIEDAILLKPGPLTPAERTRMQVHSRIGAQCIEQIGRRLGDANFLELAAQIALYHHERWDGSGYPHGLRGESIPLSARIVAIADVYDALSAQRVYKAPIPHERCLEIIRKESGKHFDPRIVDAFLLIEQDILRIRECYATADSDMEAKDQECSQRREHVDSLMSDELEQQLLKAIGDMSPIAGRAVEREHVGSPPVGP